MRANTVILILIAIVLLLLAGFGYLLLSSLNRLDVPALAVILGALAGSIGGMFGAGLTSIVNFWSRERESQERLKDRASSHALELTRMDLEMRLTSLKTFKRKQIALAPVKAYRELYKALLNLHDTKDWPPSINELGLLRILDWGSDEAPEEFEPYGPSKSASVSDSEAAH